MAAIRQHDQAPLLDGVLEEVWIRLSIALSFTAAIMDFVAFLYIPTEQNLTLLASKDPGALNDLKTCQSIALFFNYWAIWSWGFLSWNRRQRYGAWLRAIPAPVEQYIESHLRRCGRSISVI